MIIGTARGHAIATRREIEAATLSIRKLVAIEDSAQLIQELASPESLAMNNGAAGLSLAESPASALVLSQGPDNIFGMYTPVL